MKKPLFYSLIGLFSALFLFSAVMIVRYFYQSAQQKKVYDELAHIMADARQTLPQIPTLPDGTQSPESVWVTVTDPETDQPVQLLPEFIQLYSMNNDIVGWIRIPGTRCDYPVMQTPGQRDYYLKRNFNRDSSDHGAIYAREECDIFAPSDNITIYGHHMKDGSMFAMLESYKKESFWREHRTVEFSTLKERHTYEIFAVFTTTASLGKGFRYHAFIDAAVQEDFDAFVSQCKALSLYDTGITPQYGDQLITLSTCEYSQTNGRMVVVARRID